MPGKGVSREGPDLKGWGLHLTGTAEGGRPWVGRNSLNVNVHRELGEGEIMQRGWAATTKQEYRVPRKRPAVHAET